jgi:hypothetical protein
MFGQGNVYGETNLQSNHESAKYWDVDEKKHIHKVKGANQDHMSALFGGDSSQEQQSPRQSTHHVHNDAYLRESVSGLTYGRRKWCQVDSEHRREQSVLQKSAMNSLGGHLQTFSSNGASSGLNHTHEGARALTPRNRNASYVGRNSMGRRWRTNDITSTVSPRVGQNINDEILHRGLTERVVKKQHDPTSFLDAAQSARNGRKAIQEVMNYSRKDIIDYNDQTRMDSTQRMLQRFEQRAPPGEGINRVLNSDRARESLENHSPRQDMVYLQRSNNLKKPRAIASSGEGNWNIAPKIGTTMQRQDKIGVKSRNITDKPYLNQNVPMNSLQRKLEERGAPPIQEITGKVSKRRFDMTDLSRAQKRSIDKGIAGAGQKVSTLCGPQQSLRDVMLEGNGNPITGAMPKHYAKFTFRDVELASKAGAAKQDMADRHARDLGHQFTLHHH